MDALQIDVGNLQTDLDAISDHVTSSIQDQLDAIVLVNDTQTTNITDLRNDLDELQGDHDIHVSNSVLLTGTQTIGGDKSFSSYLTTNGIENIGGVETTTLSVNDLAIFGNEAVIHSTKPVTTDSLVLSTGTTGMLVGQVSIPSMVMRLVHWNIPINIKSDVVAPLFAASIDVTDTLTEVQYSVLDELSNTIENGVAIFNRQLRLVYTYSVHVPSTGTFEVRLQSGTCFVSFTSPMSSIDKTYPLFLSCVGSLTHNGGGFIGASRGYDLNSALFPIASPGSDQGTYYSFHPSITFIMTHISNYP
ncbi:hypothetical protein EON65_46640 [archaeon]|nr:MAG: hypothetical protein EON65_46640 [archaeon]